MHLLLCTDFDNALCHDIEIMKKSWLKQIERVMDNDRKVFDKEYKKW